MNWKKKRNLYVVYACLWILWFFGFLTSLRFLHWGAGDAKVPLERKDTPLDGGPDVKEKHYCEATGGWYACGVYGCSYKRPCPSNDNLLYCSCTVAGPTRAPSPLPEGGPDVREKHFCEATGGWYACGAQDCDFVRRCPSDEGLLHCSCSMPSLQEVKEEKDTEVLLEFLSRSPCNAVIAGLPLADWEDCTNYLALPLTDARSKCKQPAVPRILAAVGKTDQLPPNIIMTASLNPEFTISYYSDEKARDFVGEFCGADAAAAYGCFVVPAFRADLFRFCKLFVDGGVYMDTDILLTGKIDESVSLCAGATIGHDIPQGVPQKTGELIKFPGMQMKLLAARPKHPLMQCMLEGIIDNVRRRHVPPSPLLLSGPLLLHKCYEIFNNDVDITYRDTRGARWPYSGLMGRKNLVAFETPYEGSFSRDFVEIDENATMKAGHYSALYPKGIVYRDDCALYNSNG